MKTFPSRVTKSGTVVPAFVVDDRFEEDVSSMSWSWNGRYLFTTRRSRGAGTVFEGRRVVMLHQFIWSIAGMTKARELDHVNNDRLDNRLENLRPATRVLNGLNRIFKKKKNGLPQGVYRSGPSSWRARLYGKDGAVHLGTFSSVSAASDAYIKARAEKIISEAKGELSRIGGANGA